MDSASLITGIRARGIAVADVSDVDLTAVITEALYEYSRYRPLISVRTFDTVANQQAYTPTQMGDASLTRVIDLWWNPYQEADVWDSAIVAFLGIPTDEGDWHLPSLAEVANIKANAWNNSYGGRWHMFDPEGGSVYLDPMPEQSGDTVYLVYEEPVAIADIKTSDRSIFLDLVESMCAHRLASEISTKSSATRVKTPEYEIQVGEQIKSWRDRGDSLRKQFISKCQAGRSAAQRS